MGLLLVFLDLSLSLALPLGSNWNFHRSILLLLSFGLGLRLLDPGLSLCDAFLYRSDVQRTWTVSARLGDKVTSGKEEHRAVQAVSATSVALRNSDDLHPSCFDLVFTCFSICSRFVLDGIAVYRELSQ